MTTVTNKVLRTTTTFKKIPIYVCTYKAPLQVPIYNMRGWDGTKFIYWSTTNINLIYNPFPSPSGTVTNIQILSIT